jgi:hypothetical protein
MMGELHRRHRNTDGLRYWYAAALITSLMLLSILYVVNAHAWTQYGNAVGGNLDSAVNIQDTLAAVKGSSTITATPGASDVTLSIKGTGFNSLFDTQLGLKSTSDVAEGTAKYYLDSRARAALSGTAPVSYNSTTGAFSMAASDNATAGYLTMADHQLFAGKIDQANMTGYAEPKFSAGASQQFLRGDKTFAALTDLAIPAKTVLVAQWPGDHMVYDGTVWRNTPLAVGSPGAGGVKAFYNASPVIINTSASNTLKVNTLSATPVTSGELTVSAALSVNGVPMAAWLYNTALGQTTIPTGIWTVSMTGGVTDATDVTWAVRRMFEVVVEGMNVTTTGTGTTRTITAASGTPFVVGDANSNESLASYVQTPQGLYPIVSHTSSTVVTITTPSGYVNESVVAWNKWKGLFATPSANMFTAISPTYLPLVWDSMQPAFTVAASSKLGAIDYGASVGTTTLTLVYNGDADIYRGARVNTPMPVTTGVSATSPITYNSTTGVIAMPASDNATAGYLTAADHQLFSTVAVAGGGSGTAVKNLLINGNFNVWQRNTTSSPTATVAETSAWRVTNMPADRWRIVPAGAAITAAQETTLANLPSNNLSRLGLKLTGAANVTTVDVLQRLEGQDVIEGIRQTVTLSVNIYNGTGSAITPNLIVNTPTTTLDTWTSQGTIRLNTAYGATIPNAAWTKVSWTFDASVLTNVQLGMEVGVRIANGVLVAGKTVTFSQFQLEVGSTANTIERRTFGEELRLAQRYYEWFGSSDYSIGVLGYSPGAGYTLACTITFRVSKRAVPTVTKNGTWYAGVNSQPFFFTGTESMQLRTDTTGTGNVNSSPDSADDTVTIDSEL